MVNTSSIDLQQAAKELDLPLEQVNRTLELLDEGNTVPFITRYRKDQTGGLDDEQIRAVQGKVAKLRQLAERKTTILKSIESQGKLTPELEKQVEGARSTKLLEDIYLPFKPKKQSLAATARNRGLEPLAKEVLDAAPEAADLAARLQELVDPEKNLAQPTDVQQGIGHIIAEWFSERVDMRQALRKRLWSEGKLVSNRLPPPSPAEQQQNEEENRSSSDDEDSETKSEDAPPVESPAAEEPASDAAVSPPEAAMADPTVEIAAQAEKAESPAEASSTEEPLGDEESKTVSQPAASDPSGAKPVEEVKSASEESPTESDAIVPPEPAPAAAIAESSAEKSDAPAAEAEATTAEPAADATVSTEEPAATESPADSEPAKPSQGAKKKSAKKKSGEGKQLSKAAISKQLRKEAKKRKRSKLESSFKNYFQFSQSLAQLPPHRVLAINRGERVNILKVKIEADQEALLETAEKIVIPEGHPHAEFLKTCVRDSLTRLVLPSLEREIRRELGDKAENHAVEVFARNLRKLMLQPPVHGKRVLAIDPGFRSGCKAAAIDEFGHVLDYTLVHVIGREDRCRQGRAKLVEMIEKHAISVIAIGNGAACRETEQLAASIIGTELKDRDAAYTIVNEAGASVYSTSPIGREELPTFDPVLRSAISIGRRLLDPLSELVKINPANIGVGMYQHDVKNKQLRETLDGVVESCVNFVGVDVNTASPSLLRYVSGMNQLTARRVFEYRRDHGPFKSREDFKKVPGFGEAAFIQAAGFLRIPDGDNPLDGTWIHPESYELAIRVLNKLDTKVEELVVRNSVKAKPVFGGDITAETPEATTAETAPTITEAESPAAEPVTPVESEAAATEVPPDEATADTEAEPASPAEGQPETAPATSSAAESQVAESPVAESTPAAAEAATAEPASQVSSDTPAMRRLSEKAAAVNAADLAAELGAGELLLKDILTALTRRGRDPREDLPPPDFRRGIMKIEDLSPGMELSGTVLNVVDFGAFVDIGLSDSGLVHISRLADQYVRDPHEVVSVGDVLTVWVVEVDKANRRVSLSAIEPGAEKPRPQRQPRREKQSNRPQGQGRKRDSQKPRGGKFQQRPPRPAKPPKPVKPITKEMMDGKEPMRSFSDLAQLFEKRDDKKK